MDQGHEKVAALRGAPRHVVARLALLACLFLLACGAEDRGAAPVGAGGESDGGATSQPYRPDLPYVVSVESFSPGEGAGFNQDLLPDVVLGPPQGKGTGQGSLD